MAGESHGKKPPRSENRIAKKTQRQDGLGRAVFLPDQQAVEKCRRCGQPGDGGREPRKKTAEIGKPDCEKDPAAGWARPRGFPARSTSRRKVPPLRPARRWRARATEKNRRDRKTGLRKRPSGRMGSAARFSCQINKP